MVVIQIHKQSAFVPAPITDAIVTDDRPSEPMDAPIALR